MSLAEDIEAARRASVEKYLVEAKGHVDTAAKLAGVHRSNFYRLITRYGLTKKGGYSRNRGNAAWQSLRPTSGNRHP